MKKINKSVRLHLYVFWILTLSLTQSCNPTLTLRGYEKERSEFFGGSTYREVLIPDSLKSHDTNNLRYTKGMVTSANSKVNLKYTLLIDRKGLIRDYSVYSGYSDSKGTKPIELSNSGYWEKLSACSYGPEAEYDRCVAQVKQQLIDDCDRAFQSLDENEIRKHCWFLDTPIQH